MLGYRQSRKLLRIFYLFPKKSRFLSELHRVILSGKAASERNDPGFFIPDELYDLSLSQHASRFSHFAVSHTDMHQVITSVTDFAV